MIIASAQAFATYFSKEVSNQEANEELWGHEPLIRCNLTYSLEGEGVGTEQPIQIVPSCFEIKRTVLRCFDSMSKSLIPLPDLIRGACNLDISAPAITADGWAAERQVVAARYAVHDL
jgi:hypothetical protein